MPIYIVYKINNLKGINLVFLYINMLFNPFFFLLKAKALNKELLSQIMGGMDVRKALKSKYIHSI